MLRPKVKRRAVHGLPVVGAVRPDDAAEKAVALPEIPSLWLRAGLAAAAVMVVVAMLAVMVYRSDVLRVQTVRVEGTVVLEPGAVADAARVTGKSVLTLDEDAAARRVRAAHPNVRAASVHRDWPQGVVITVQEREPWAVWYSGTSRYVIDQEGTVLERGEPAAGAVTVTHAGGNGNLRPGDTVDADALHLAQRVLEAAPEGVRIASFQYQSESGLIALTDRGVEVRLGDGVDLEYKLAVWRAIHDQAEETGAALSLIDLRFGDRPYFR